MSEHQETAGSGQDPWATSWLERWDRQQEGYVEARDATFAVIERAVRHLVPEPRTTLDLGCGPATLARRMAEAFPGARVVGVDADPVLLHIAEGAHGDRVEVQRRDLTDPAWTEGMDDDSVDVVVSATALHYLAPHHVEVVVDGLARVLRRDGLFVNADTLPGGASAPRLRDHLAVEREEVWDAPFVGGEDFGQWWAALRADDRPGLAELFADRDACFPHAAHDMTSLPTWCALLTSTGFAEVEVLAQAQDTRVLAALR